MTNIGGVSNFGGFQGPDKPTEQKQLPASNFNPNAQVVSPHAQSQAAAMARLQMKKSAKVNGEQERNADGDFEIDVETIGLIRINDEQLERFKERVEQGLKRQEEQIIDAVNTFAGSEENLRNIIGSIMLSQQ